MFKVSYLNNPPPMFMQETLNKHMGHGKRYESSGGLVQKRGSLGVGGGNEDMIRVRCSVCMCVFEIVKK